MAGAAAKPRSLKARALQWLAQREHSRVELRRKLLRSLQTDAARAERAASAPSGAAGAATGQGQGHEPGQVQDPAQVQVKTQEPVRPPAPVDEIDAGARVDETLDWLQSHGYLSEQRFVESRVHARTARYGNLRIRGELQQHRLALSDEQARGLQASEAARAGAVLARRFSAPPRDAAERARQIRFLMSRGFTQDAVKAAMRGRQSEASEDAAD